jgi:hypothetical protein
MYPTNHGSVFNFLLELRVVISNVAPSITGDLMLVDMSYGSCTYDELADLLVRFKLPL